MVRQGFLFDPPTTSPRRPECGARLPPLQLVCEGLVELAGTGVAVLRLIAVSRRDNLSDTLNQSPAVLYYFLYGMGSSEGVYRRRTFHSLLYLSSREPNRPRIMASYDSDDHSSLPPMFLVDTICKPQSKYSMQAHIAPLQHSDRHRLLLSSYVGW